MVDSIHGELRKPSAAVVEARKIAANLRAKKQHDPVRKNAKLTPIDTKSLPGDSGAIGITA